jgi:NAD(P)-dependent dehydrogenase (short-subunit alcohol dehydrogenase family)
VAADVADEAAATAMIAGIRQRFVRLDTLVLSASGGHERIPAPRCASTATPSAAGRAGDAADAPPGPRRLRDQHQAHFYPHKAVPKGYAPIAASMRAGETAMYGMRYDSTAAESISPWSPRHDRRHRLPAVAA